VNVASRYAKGERAGKSIGKKKGTQMEGRRDGMNHDGTKKQKGVNCQKTHMTKNQKKGLRGGN